MDWYDYGWRFYDPTIARWHAVDPLAEKYYPISPYAYVADNPLRFIDPDGRYITDYGVMPCVTIERIGEVNDEPDRLFALNENKEIINSITPETINDKSILPSLSKYSQVSLKEKVVDSGSGETFVYDVPAKLRTANSSSLDDMARSFLFLSNNSKVEWRLHQKNDNTFGLSSFGIADWAPSDHHLNLPAGSVKRMIHSHPNTILSKEISSMSSDHGFSKYLSRCICLFSK